MFSRLRILQNMRQIRAASTLNAISKETSTLTLFVNQLPWTVSARELQQYFARFGPISKSEVVFDEKTGISRGYGYVTFSMSHSYVKALQAEDHMLDGRLLEVEQSKNFKKSKNYDEDK